ncbi:hypothetical protein LPB140_06540 [Sphingorhabdus lutea]|uniref:Uncharacterized protein n=1 Tax=Sphingorhabdus lutea TaxID=1913578 RepID=A0A1L3JBK0_9SPHN|nr:glycosyl hydrolase 108 family protein [Sphingorhabdus lutea]APG62502.1 hypothetical protein LPB140_06540 [Sphingorhabdus lutea]
MIENLLDKIIKVEGGYIDHPDDKGGPTKYGITEKVARQCGYDGAMRDISIEFAKNIYRKQYWTGPQFHKIYEIAPIISAKLFDIAVNMGNTRSIKFLQRALNALNRQEKDYHDLRIDGQIGPSTLTATSQFIAYRGPQGAKVLVKAINALQGHFYIEISEKRPRNESFTYGWIANRIG